MAIENTYIMVKPDGVERGLVGVEIAPAITEHPGPVVAMEWSGESAVLSARNVMGATNPADATPGSIRGDLATLLTENIVHGSDSVESAERELSIWF